MVFRVRLMPEAEEEAERLYRWLISKAPLHGQEWFNSLVTAINSLRTNPRRCPLAPENSYFEEEILQLL